MVIPQVAPPLVELVWIPWLQLYSQSHLCHSQINLCFLSKRSVSCGGFMPPYICGLFYKLCCEFSCGVGWIPDDSKVLSLMCIHMCQKERAPQIVRELRPGALIFRTEPAESAW